MANLSPNKLQWWQSVLSGIEEDFRLRRVLMAVRRAEVCSKVRGEDRLHIKPAIFASAFLLFNASLALLYLSLSSKQAMRSLKVPAALLGFAVLAYKVEVEWVSREIIRKSEGSRSDVGYLVRRQLLEECGQHPLVKSRVKILEAKNKQYEQLYMDEK